MGEITGGLASMLYSRKFWLAIVALVQSIVLSLTDFPPELWVSVNALLAAVIAATAYEDAALKRAGKLPAISAENLLVSLLRSRKVWLAFLGMAQSWLFYFVPNFPKEIWLSANGVLIILIGSIAVEDAAAKSYVKK